MGSGASKVPDGEKLQEGEVGVHRVNKKKNDKENKNISPDGTTRGESTMVLAQKQEQVKLEQLAKHADPTTLDIIRIVMQADRIPLSRASEKLVKLEQCHHTLEQRGQDDFPLLHILVSVKEGQCYVHLKDMKPAKELLCKAIALSEKLVARRAKDICIVLHRYVEAMIGLSRVWYEEEKENSGFQLSSNTSAQLPRRPGITPPQVSARERAETVISMSSSTSSVGSVFSLKHEVLKAMVPHQPRRATGPTLRRIKLPPPRITPGTEYIDGLEDEFVLHSTLPRELLSSPCELLLLRCCEVVELAHCRQSELLPPVLEALAQLYEDIELYGRAILLIRRSIGIILSAYDYDHPYIVQLRRHIDELSRKLDVQKRSLMAIKIQATWKMHVCMRQLEETLGRPVHRHIWIPSAFRDSKNDGFLNSFLEGDSAEDHDEEDHDEEDHDEEEFREGSEKEEPHTFTAFLPNAVIIGSTQEAVTETSLEPGVDGAPDVLTVQTTTVTKTVAEKGESEDPSRDDSGGDGDAASSHSISIHEMDGQRNAVAVHVTGEPPEREEMRTGAAQMMTTTTEATITALEAGDLLTIRQVTVTETIAERDVEESDGDNAVPAREREQVSGLADDDDCVSESTFFTHRSTQSNRASDISMIVRNEAVREAMPTGRLPRRSNSRQVSAEEARGSSNLSSSLPHLRSSPSASPSLELRTPGKPHSALQAVPQAFAAAPHGVRVPSGSSEPMRNSSSPTTAPRSSSPSVALPALRPRADGSVSPSLHKSRSDSAAEDSHSQVSSILSAARRNRTAWVAK